MLCLLTYEWSRDCETALGDNTSLAPNSRLTWQPKAPI